MKSPITVTHHANVTDEHAYREALTISAHFSRVAVSTLYIVSKIFAASRDGRVKKGGYLFIAHLLRFSVLDQLSLFPGTEICDVAKITIPNILKLCTNKAGYDWPWCYDTTLKYIKLLVAAGVLLTRPGERGIYYLPLGQYALLPQHARTQIVQLAKKRPKISRSTAFKRTVEHCMSPPSPVESEIADSSSKKEALTIDEQEVQRAALAINAALQRQQGVTLLPTTLREIMHVLREYTPRVVKKSVGTPLTVSAQSLLPLTNASRQITEDVYEGVSTTSDGCIPYTQQDASNLPNGEELVDSRRTTDSSVTESVISFKNKPFSSENTEFTINGQQRKRKQGGESASCSRIVDSSTAGDDQVEQEARDLSEETVHHWAAQMSRYFEGNDSKIGHYTTLLRQSPEILHIAIVDALVRSQFPDPHRKPDRLKGGWVTDRYKAYCAGAEKVPPEIFAWSQTGLTYQELERVLAVVAKDQDVRGQPRIRPFPHEIPDGLIVDSGDLVDFWLQGAGRGLEEKGCLFVSSDGDLLTPMQYQSYRRRCLMPYLLENEALASYDATVEHELFTYVEWYQSRRYSPEEAAMLLKEMPPTIGRSLQEQVGRLEAVLDLERYDVEVVLLPVRRGIPIKHALAIEVRAKVNPGGESWLLTRPDEVQQFVEDWQHERCTASEPQVQTDTSSKENKLFDEKSDEGENQHGDLRVGDYVVTFKDTHVMFEHGRTHTQYLVHAETHLTVVDFVRNHHREMLAMMSNALDELEIFRIRQ